MDKRQCYRKNLWARVDKKLNVSQQHAFWQPQTGLHQMECTQQVKEIIIPLCSALMQLYLEYCT